MRQREGLVFEPTSECALAVAAVGRATLGHETAHDALQLAAHIGAPARLRAGAVGAR